MIRSRLLTSSLSASGPRLLPPTDELVSSDGLVEPVALRSEASGAKSTAAESDKPILSLDEISEGLKQRDAKVKDSSIYGRGMTLVLDDEGKKYIRFLTWGQVWTTATENNPGTVGVDDQFNEDSLDIGLRRVRFLTYSQLTERYLILLHVGINNQTFTTGGDTGTREFGSDTKGFGPGGVGKKPQIFVHDFWNEYTIFPQSDDSDFSLATGAGLHYWNGISRKSSSSTSSYMTVDSNIFCWPNIEFTDQFARQLGWYFKGKLHKLDYRFSINQPFNTDDRASLNTERAVNIAADTLSTAGYFEWEFWDQESNLLPYKLSTWLGEKSVFNIGAGFYAQPDASGILDANRQLQTQDHLAVGIDCYYDKPVGDNGAVLTVYGVYYIYDYGDNYFRNIGIMNTGVLGTPEQLAAAGIEPTISGAGNAQPFMGTGEIFYLEGGYVLPSWLWSGTYGKLQPFGAFTHKNLEWLDDPVFNWDMGVNYLIDGHRAKITLQYSLRPQVFERTIAGSTQRVADGTEGQVILQAQIAL